MPQTENLKSSHREPNSIWWTKHCESHLILAFSYNLHNQLVQLMLLILFYGRGNPEPENEANCQCYTLSEGAWTQTCSTINFIPLPFTALHLLPSHQSWKSQKSQQVVMNMGINLGKVKNAFCFPSFYWWDNCCPSAHRSLNPPCSNPGSRPSRGAIHRRQCLACRPLPAAPSPSCLSASFLCRWAETLHSPFPTCWIVADCWHPLGSVLSAKCRRQTPSSGTSQLWWDRET